MRILRTIAAGVLACSFAVGTALTSPIAQAQDVTAAQTVQAQLDVAIAAGDTKAIAALIQANQGNTAVLTMIANTLLASATATAAGSATQAANAAGAATLAALAVLSGGLTTAQAQAATALAA